jgi:hypothetical protein
MRADLRRRGVDASHLVIVEIGLLDAPVLEADLANGRKADALHDGSFELCSHTIGIDHGAAIEGKVHARDRQFAIGSDRHLDDNRGGEVKPRVMEGVETPLAVALRVVGSLRSPFAPPK